MQATPLSIPLCLEYRTTTREAFEVDIAATVEWPQVCPSPGGKTLRPVFVLGFCQSAKTRSILAAVEKTGRLAPSKAGDLPIELLRTLGYSSFVQECPEQGGTAITWLLTSLFQSHPVPIRIDGDAVISFISMPSAAYLREDASRRGDVWRRVLEPWKRSADPHVWAALADAGEDLVGPLCAYWCMSIYGQVSTPLLTDEAFQAQLVFTLIRGGQIQVATGLRQGLPQACGPGAYGFCAPLFTYGLASKIEAVISATLRSFGTGR